MYPLTPFHYLLEALLTFVEHENVVECSAQEFGRFAPPNGQTCQEYAGAFVAQAGGYLNNPMSTTQCEYCQYATGDEYTASLQVYWENRYRDYGIFWAYVIFNIFIVFIFTYFYCGGFKTIAGKLRTRGRGGHNSTASKIVKDQSSIEGEKKHARLANPALP